MSPERRAIMSGNTADGAKDALHIDVDHAIPFLGIAASNLSGDIASRVGELDAAKALSCHADHCRDVGGPREVQRDGDTLGAEFVLERLQFLRRARDESKFDALPRQSVARPHGQCRSLLPSRSSSCRSGFEPFSRLLPASGRQFPRDSPDAETR
jgi:hypothetical protein